MALPDFTSAIVLERDQVLEVLESLLKERHGRQLAKSRRLSAQHNPALRHISDAQLEQMIIGHARALATEPERRRAMGNVLVEFEHWDNLRTAQLATCEAEGRA